MYMLADFVGTLVGRFCWNLHSLSALYSNSLKDLDLHFMTQRHVLSLNQNVQLRSFFHGEMSHLIKEQAIKQPKLIDFRNFSRHIM